MIENGIVGFGLSRIVAAFCRPRRHEIAFRKPENRQEMVWIDE
jgi:heterodisulfide reductase subunit A-like polyferredoxin